MYPDAYGFGVPMSMFTAVPCDPGRILRAGKQAYLDLVDGIQATASAAYHAVVDTAGSVLDGIAHFWSHPDTGIERTRAPVPGPTAGATLPVGCSAAEIKRWAREPQNLGLELPTTIAHVNKALRDERLYTLPVQDLPKDIMVELRSLATRMSELNELFDDQPQQEQAARDAGARFSDDAFRQVKNFSNDDAGSVARRDLAQLALALTEAEATLRFVAGSYCQPAVELERFDIDRLAALAVRVTQPTLPTPAIPATAAPQAAPVALASRGAEAAVDAFADLPFIDDLPHDADRILSAT
jgi:hypothetical protein